MFGLNNVQVAINKEFTRYSRNIVESFIKHHDSNPKLSQVSFCIGLRESGRIGL
jgi:hypothetical protein